MYPCRGEDRWIALTVTGTGEEPWTLTLRVPHWSADAWTVTVTLRAPQKIIATWNASTTWDSSGNVMTARPNGNGNVFGFTIQHGGNWNWPSLTCRVG